MFTHNCSKMNHMRWKFNDPEGNWVKTGKTAPVSLSHACDQQERTEFRQTTAARSPINILCSNNLRHADAGLLQVGCGIIIFVTESQCPPDTTHPYSKLPRTHHTVGCSLYLVKASGLDFPEFCLLPPSVHTLLPPLWSLHISHVQGKLFHKASILAHFDQAALY